MARQFSDVHLEAEHVPEAHRTLENDLSVTERELPGSVNVFLVIDGGRLLLDQFKAGKVFDAIELAGQQAKQQEQAQQQAQAQELGTA